MSETGKLLDTMAQVARDGSLVTLECWSEKTTGDIPNTPDEVLIWRCSIGDDDMERGVNVCVDKDNAETAMRCAIEQYERRK